MMAAKAVLNDLYQRLRSCVVYKTQADADGFVCHLLLPAVECSHPAFAAEQHFEGRGNSKKVGVPSEQQCSVLITYLVVLKVQVVAPHT
jgi:hypothetical protein